MPLGVKDDHVPRVIDGVVPVVRRDLRKGHADLGPEVFNGVHHSRYAVKGRIKVAHVVMKALGRVPFRIYADSRPRKSRAPSA